MLGKRRDRLHRCQSGDRSGVSAIPALHDFLPGLCDTGGAGSAGRALGSFLGAWGQHTHGDPYIEFSGLHPCLLGLGLHTGLSLQYQWLGRGLCLALPAVCGRCQGQVPPGAGRDPAGQDAYVEVTLASYVDASSDANSCCLLKTKTQRATLGRGAWPSGDSLDSTEKSQTKAQPAPGLKTRCPAPGPHTHSLRHQWPSHSGGFMSIP